MADEYLAYECEVIERLKERYFGRVEKVFIDSDLFFPCYYNTMPIVVDHFITFKILDDFCSAATIKFRRSEWKRAFRSGVQVEDLVNKMIERISKNLKQYAMR